MIPSTPSEQADLMPHILERGDIFILYQPVDEDKESVAPNDDRFYLLLHPHRAHNYRLITLGRSCQPAAGAHRGGGERYYWGRVEEIIRTDRQLQEHFVQSSYAAHRHGDCSLLALRAAGMGDYMVMQQGNDTYLSYVLMQPVTHDDVHPMPEIAPAASYQIRVKHPDGTRSEITRLPEITQLEGELAPEREAALPATLLDCFADHHFVCANPPNLLDHEGVAFLLIDILADGH